MLLQSSSRWRRTINFILTTVTKIASALLGCILLPVAPYHRIHSDHRRKTMTASSSQWHRRKKIGSALLDRILLSVAPYHRIHSDRRRKKIGSALLDRILLSVAPTIEASSTLDGNANALLRYMTALTTPASTLPCTRRLD